MINNISFGSTYRVNLNENNWDKLGSFHQIGYDVAEENITTQMYSSWNRNDAHHTLVVNDAFDNRIETFLKSKNIKFHKYTTAELFTEKNIKSRLVVPNKNYPTPRYLPHLVNINTENFDKAFRNSDTYISPEDKLSDSYRYDSFKAYLKSAESIDASEVYISAENGKPKIDFQDGRHRYAVMRDMGFKTIPVAMDAESLRTAIKFKLV